MARKWELLREAAGTPVKTAKTSLVTVTLMMVLARLESGAMLS